ncbi:hypothetical protein SAMN05216326_11910 [Nitrosomonas marina]|uniref:Uncharacterized protein n=1 Tax=Nitrosomonas marina TaxID=917 RepID=A0A1I0DAP4_9PROT|nr:hypothetical protein [Nitrosomonas marina]SET29023.1 hypothetical protein SAMN05216326_11910 [Nitrosomonas marina]
MKTGKLVVLMSFFAILILDISVNSFASAHNDEDCLGHDILARQYENMARDMQDRIQEQMEILEVLNRKPHFSFFEANGRNLKNYVANKIRGCESAATAYLDKAAYHQTMASQDLVSDHTAEAEQTGHH